MYFICRKSNNQFSVHITLQGTKEEWEKVWYICAGFFAVGAFTYVLLGSGEVQPWAVPPEERYKAEDNIDGEKVPQSGQHNLAFTKEVGIRQDDTGDTKF